MAYNKYNNQPEPDDESEYAKYNAGMFHTMRLNEIQAEINKLWNNPLSFNIEFNNFNYMIIKNRIDRLYSEVRPKLKDDEKISGDKLRKATDNFLQKHPIHETKISQPRRTSVQVNLINWKYYKELLTKYENVVKDFMEVHQLNNPPKGESALF